MELSLPGMGVEMSTRSRATSKTARKVSSPGGQPWQAAASLAAACISVNEWLSRGAGGFSREP